MNKNFLSFTQTRIPWVLPNKSSLSSTQQEFREFHPNSTKSSTQTRVPWVPPKQEFPEFNPTRVPWVQPNKSSLSPSQTRAPWVLTKKEFHHPPAQFQQTPSPMAWCGDWLCKLTWRVADGLLRSVWAACCVPSCLLGPETDLRV